MFSSNFTLCFCVVNDQVIGTTLLKRNLHERFYRFNLTTQHTGAKGSPSF